MTKENRKIFTIESGIDDKIELISDGEKLIVCVENEWAGDTETGFGESGNITLKLEQVMMIADFIDEHIKINRSN